MNQVALDWSILWPALIAGLLVTATHVPLGMQVLSRGIVFIDLAIAQIAGLGVIAADWAGFEPQGWGVQVAALIAAVAGALLLTCTEKHWPEVQEALEAARVAELSTPTLSGGESWNDILNDRSIETMDVDAAGEKGYGFVRLHQLAVEHLMGAR